LLHLVRISIYESTSEVEWLQYLLEQQKDRGLNPCLPFGQLSGVGTL